MESCLAGGISLLGKGLCLLMKALGERTQAWNVRALVPHPGHRLASHCSGKHGSIEPWRHTGQGSLTHTETQPDVQGCHEHEPSSLFPGRSCYVLFCSTNMKGGMLVGVIPKVGVSQSGEGVRSWGPCGSRQSCSLMRQELHQNKSDTGRFMVN